MKTNLRTYYIRLKREAKRLSSLSKDPTIPRAKTWDISRQASNKRRHAEFYENYLYAIGRSDNMLDAPKGLLDQKTFINTEVHQLRRYVDEDKLYEYIMESKLTTDKIKDDTIAKLKEVGPLSYADLLEIFYEIVVSANPVPMDGILEVDLPINKTTRPIILYLMKKYNCNKVFKSGSTKNVKTLKDLDNLR